MELESKAAAIETPEVKQAFGEFMQAFEQFRQENDRRLADLERRSADVLTEEKVDRINQALTEQKKHLDALMLAGNRPMLSGERKSAADFARGERKAAFDSYVRKGDAGGLIEVKSLSEASNPDGGYTVPLEIERTIDRVLATASPIRAIATVRQIGAGVYRKPITTAGAATGWVGETDAVAQTGTPTAALAQQAYEVMPNHQGVSRPADAQGRWHASAEPFAHLALWGVKDLYALVEALAARVAALEAEKA